MAAAVASATRRAAVPEQRTKPEVVSFEKELSYELAPLKKLAAKRDDHALRQRLFNGLFQLWNKYERKVRREVFSRSLLATGDTLYRAEEYRLASTHCYGRYLSGLRAEGRGEEEGREGEEEGGEEWIVRYCRESSSPEAVAFVLRAAIGRAACEYYDAEKKDIHLMHPHTQSVALDTLRQLQASSQAALQREAHYWLAYNCTLLTYSISRRLMSVGLASTAVEPLLWAAVCMESSVPLMALKYLQLRADIYTAICQCYYYLKEPYQAELFARRALGKVHELAVLEHHSSSLATAASERVFAEASLKLSVMVFRRSVLESRAKTAKGVFRPKKRPSMREMLQQPCPRSPTEKLLGELFVGEAAQFLAVVEALSEPSRRPLEQGPPHPITSLDAETATDVFQELLCIGTDLVLRASDRWEGNRREEEETKEEATASSLLEAAVDGTDSIPVSSALRFIRLALSYDQREMVDMLLERTMAATKVSTEVDAHHQELCLQLQLLVAGVKGLSGRRVTLPAAEGITTIADEPGSKLLQLSAALHTACADHAFLVQERDLLQDSVLFLWETLRAVFSKVHSHHESTTQPLSGSRRGQEYITILRQVVVVLDQLDMWQAHPLLCGELSLKLACLEEASANLPQAATATEGVQILYDRARLLVCLTELERGQRWVWLARAREKVDQPMEEELAVLHSELLYAATRVRVKLASTIPPPVTPEPTQKLSSLKEKVRERREKQQKREQFLSSLTAQDSPVETVNQLLEGCGQSPYHSALLAMLQAVFTPTLTAARKTALLQEAASLLLQLTEQESASPPPAPSPSPSSSSPPPPILLHCTRTAMTFKPAPWNPPHGQKVSYYQLYGRPSKGSNVRVRLSDKTYPGLGVEVPAGPGCALEVSGLQPNMEYVFAVAAYDKRGQLLGGQMGQVMGRPTEGNIGQTGKPVLASFTLPVLAAWGYCCQCAFQAAVPAVACRAADVLWTHFVATESCRQKEKEKREEGEGEREEGEMPQLSSLALSSTHSSILHHFIHSVFIYVHLTSPPLPSHPPPSPPPSPTLLPDQLHCLELCHRLLLALEAGGVVEQPALCTQAIVMGYGLLAPLLQREIATKSVAKILLHWHCTLAEMPDHLLPHRHPSTQGSLHHMIATTAFYLGKMLLKWQQTNLFSSLSDNARGLLLLTMPAVSLNSLCTQEVAGGLDQSMTSQALSLSSYTTISSGFPGLLAPRGAQKKKKGKKRAVTLADQIAEEAKSSEYKAFEAFVMANCKSLSTHPSLDDDLTGQEDPLVLHAIIATLPALQAYKEVHKFKRRPQYLEFFVHLASAGMAQGHHEKVLEWGQETFTWLTRRNDILLSTKPVVHPQPQQTKPHPSLPPSRAPSKHKLTSTTTSRPHSRAVVSAKTPGTQSHRSKASSSLGDSINRGRPTSQPKKPTKALVKRSGQSSVSGKQRASVLAHSLPQLLAVEGVTVTREDLMMKATSVLQTLLPEMWRNHKCRKRLREVCGEELSWRAQANLLLAQCQLDGLLARLPGQGERQGNPLPPDQLRLEGAGVIIDRVIPTYPPSVPEYKLQQHTGHDLPLTPLDASGGTKNSIGSGEREGGGGGGRRKSKTLGSAQAPHPDLRELQQTMVHLQRAIVLAHREGLWVLLQNACRVLWNCINALTSLLGGAGGQAGGEGEGEGTGKAGPGALPLAAVYGMALKPLYFSMEATADLISACGPSHSTPPDTSLTPDLSSLLRLSLLAAHTLYSQQHWEKVVSVGLRLCEGVRGEGGEGREWVEQLVPVILQAQSKLAERVREHAGDIQKEALEPAAHLDPGRDGHDVYGPVGQALARVCVPLDPQIVLRKLQMGQEVEDSPKHALQQCRVLLSRYLAGQSGAVGALQCFFPVDECTTDLPPLPRSQLPLVVSRYNEAISRLEADGDRVLAACAMHELGNVHHHTGSVKSAGHWWGRALSALLQSRAILTSWRKVVEGEEGRRGGRVVERCGLPGTMLAGILATKMARYVHRNEMGTSLEYIFLASALCKSVLTSSLPHSPSDLSYLPPPDSSSLLIPGVELFSDPHLCDPQTTLSSLQHCARELVGRGYAVKALPILWLYDHTANSVCRDTPHTVFCRALKVQALTQLSLFSEALSLLSDLLSGSHMAQESCHHDCLAEPHSSVKFSNSLPLNDQSNIKVLTAAVTQEPSPSLAQRCGPEATLRLSLARAQLYTALASSCTAIPAQSILGRSADSSLSRPATVVSSTPQSSEPSSVSSLHSSTAALPTTRLARLKKQCTPQDVKLFLLEQAERLLLTVCHASQGLPSPSLSVEVRTLAYLSLSQVALSLGHSTSAAQLCLAALRQLQVSGGVDQEEGRRGREDEEEEEEGEGGSEGEGKRGGSEAEVGVRLWLECRRSLAESLVGFGTVGGTKERISGEGGRVLSCAVQCGEGVREAEECGDPGLAAEFHFISALHALSSPSPDTAGAMKHAQNTLLALESIPHPPSLPLLLLRCQSSLLLSDIGCLEGHISSKDAVQVFQGLANILRKELSADTSTSNGYHPALPLLASCLLRLSHSLSLLPSRPGEGGGADHTHLSIALSACEEGVEVLQSAFRTVSCLMACLMAQRASLLQELPNAERSEVTNQLLDTISTISDGRADFRLQFTSCSQLAWTLSTAIQHSPQHSPSPPSHPSHPSHPSPSLRKKKSSHSSLHPGTKVTTSPEDESSPDHKTNAERGREAYIAWCALRTAQQSLRAQQSLLLLTSQLNNPDLARPIPEKALGSLPDFALLELCASDTLLCSLLHSLDPLPCDLLSPSAQTAQATGLTWFRVVSYTSSLLQTCFWSPSLSRESCWSLHYHSLTPSLHAKYLSLASYLQHHCTIFSKSCLLPALPPSLLSPSPSKNQLPTARTTAPPIPDTLSHLSAREGEVTVLWLHPPPHPLGHSGAGKLFGEATSPPEEEDGESSHKQIVGLFGFNGKAVKPHPPPSALAAGIEVYSVSLSLVALGRLREEWQELVGAAQGCLDGRVTGRPISRSPSRQRKHLEKTQRIQAGLQVKLAQGVRSLCGAFGRHVTAEEHLPQLEPHVLPDMVSLLQTHTSHRASGDTYHFLHTLFSSTHRAPQQD